MELSLVMLGTGSAFARKYYNNNALVTGNGYNLMLDCGHTAPRALHDLGIDLRTIDGIFISHLHADHTGGLEEVAFRMKYSYNRKPSLFVPDNLVETLWEHSLRGNLENRSENLGSLHDYFRVIPVSAGVPLRLSDGFQMETVRTQHIRNKPSYGVFLNGLVYFSSDSLVDRDTLEQLVSRGCRHILHDCQLKRPEHIHATLESLLALPEELQEITYLMHYDDDMEDYIGQTGSMSFIRQHETYRFHRI